MTADTTLTDRSERNAAAARRLPMPRALMSGVLAGLIVGFLVSPLVGLAAALIVGAVVMVVMPRTAPAGVLTVIGGTEVHETDQPRLFNLIEGLGATAGVEVHDVRLLEDAAVNVAVVGSLDHATLIVCRGALASLDRVELEAVIAEALARIRSNDSHLATQAALFVCGPLVRQGPRHSGAGRSVAMIGAERRATRLASVLGDRREFLADVAAVDITNYPPGMAAALKKMSVDGTAVDAATWGTAHLWLADPLPPVADPADSRAASLNEMFGLHEDAGRRAAFMLEL